MQVMAIWSQLRIKLEHCRSRDPGRSVDGALSRAPKYLPEGGFLNDESAASHDHETMLKSLIDKHTLCGEPAE